MEDPFQARGAPKVEAQRTPSASSRSPRDAQYARGPEPLPNDVYNQRWASPGPALTPRTAYAASAQIEEPKLSDDELAARATSIDPVRPQASPGRAAPGEAWQSVRDAAGDQIRNVMAEAEKAVQDVVCATGMVGGSGSGASASRGHPGSTGGTASTGATPGYVTGHQKISDSVAESPRAVIADVESRVRAEMATVNAARRQISAGSARSPTPGTPRVAQTPRAVTPRTAHVSARGYVPARRSPGFQPPRRTATAERRHAESPMTHHRVVHADGGCAQGSTGGDTPRREREQDRRQVSPRVPLSARESPVRAGTPQSREARTEHPHSAREARGDRRAAYDTIRTSGRRPHLIMQELHRVFAAQRIAFKQMSGMSVKCQWLNLRFELEVAPLDRLSSIHAVRARHVVGEPWQYKAVLSRILAELRIA